MSKVDEVRRRFTPAELDTIAAHPVAMGEGTSDAIDLAVAWDLHVRKIDADRALPWDDHTVWTEHDLAAALFMRDFVQNALDALPPPVRSRVESVVAGVDEHFRSFTTDDPDRKMSRIAHVEVSTRPWWWRRIPVDGPIAQDLATW